MCNLRECLLIPLEIFPKHSLGVLILNMIFDMISCRKKWESTEYRVHHNEGAGYQVVPTVLVLLTISFSEATRRLLGAALTWQQHIQSNRSSTIRITTRTYLPSSTFRPPHLLSVKTINIKTILITEETTIEYESKKFCLLLEIIFRLNPGFQRTLLQNVIL